MPRGAKLIYNPSSAAPGFIVKNVLSLPGVPSILNSMIENCKQYLIKGSKVHSKTLNLFTVESNISKQLGLIQKKYKKFVDIGSYPFFRLGKIGVSIVTRSTSKTKLLLATDEDREGESISWHLLQILKPKIPTKRMVFHEITKKAINKALDETREIDMEYVEN